MDWIQGERFIDIADEVKIFYRHTHEVNEFFKEDHIKTPFVLISHNSDGSVIRGYSREEDANADLMPDNLIHWFGQNINIVDDRISSLPIGLENNKWLSNKGEKMITKLQQLKGCKNLMYMTHKINTNPNERSEPYQLFGGESWVTTGYGSHGYEFNKYIDNIYNHAFVICPEGNGIDTHRVWETLYMDTIPIEKRSINNQSRIDLPICFVDDWREINRTFLEEEYIRIKTSSWNMKKLTFKYWENKIRK